MKDQEFRLWKLEKANVARTDFWLVMINTMNVSRSWRYEKQYVIHELE